VYRNDTAGLTFVAPDGWAVHARAATLPARLDRPLRMIGYRKQAGNAVAELELYAADLADGQDVPGYLAAHPIGPEKWADRAPAKDETVNGAAAARLTLGGTGPKADTRRDVVAFRRGARPGVPVRHHL
jgi:hypothetical protein